MFELMKRQAMNIFFYYKQIHFTSSLLWIVPIKDQTKDIYNT